MNERITLHSDRSVGELFSELASETSTLVRQEMALARAEMTEKISATGRNAAYMAVGAVIALVGTLAVAAAIILGLAMFMPAWVAALAVGIVAGIAGAIIMMSAMAKLKKMEITPAETVETIKEDARWLRKQMT